MEFSKRFVFPFLAFLILPICVYAKINIEILGDSNSADYKGGGWVFYIEQDMLKERDDLVFKNRSVCGASSFELDPYVNQFIIEDHPHFVFLCLGLNNVRYPYPVEITYTSLDTIIKKYQANNCQIILGTLDITNLRPYRHLHSHAYRQLFTAIFPVLAAEHKLVTFPLITTEFLNDPLSDGLHSSDASYRRIAQEAKKALLTVLKERKE